MILPILGFVGGVGLLQVQAELPALKLALLLLVPLLVVAGTRRRTTLARLTRILAIGSFAVGSGFFWGALWASLRLADELPTTFEGVDIRLTGVVAKLPQPVERGIRFEFDVEQVLGEARVPERILLSWYGPWGGDAGTSPAGEVRAGERWQFTVRLRRPHGTANPHAFDYESSLMERGVRATGYVRAHDPPHRIDSFVPRIGYGIERGRENIRERILDALFAEPYAGVIVALVMGDQRSIPQAQWTVFTRTGVNHLMSISGLHVTMIAGLLYTMTYALWRRSVRLAARLPARRAAVLAGFAAALIYAGIAGFAVPAQRTVYMLAVTALALWLGQTSSVASMLALALLAVTLLDPWAVLAPGFWLSFGAVALILHVSLGNLRAPHWLLAWARTQWAVTLGLVPVLLAMFQQISLISPLANAIAIPVISLVVVPLALAGSALPFDFILVMAHTLMAVMMRLLEWLAAVPDSVWQQHAPPPWAVLVALAGAVWNLLPRGFPARWLGLVGFVPLFAEVPPGPAPGAVRIEVLDVGQGLCVVVRTQSHALLYDAGPVYSSDADSGSRIVVPYLRAAGVRRLDGIIITHADTDHAGGAASVLAAVPVDWLASSLPQTSSLHAAVRRSIPCYAGQRWQWDGVEFQVLHPDQESYSLLGVRTNDRSCVLRISAAGKRVLLTGDAEARSERQMLAREADRLRADILVVPHHGSTTSSTAEFIAAVRPDTAIFTVGYRNRFGHPRATIVQRYVDYGSRILRSDREGSLRMDIDFSGARIRAYREERKRYWQDQPKDFD